MQGPFLSSQITLICISYITLSANLLPKDKGQESRCMSCFPRPNNGRMALSCVTCSTTDIYHRPLQPKTQKAAQTGSFVFMAVRFLRTTHTEY